MTVAREYSFREFKKLLHENGFEYLRVTGDHYIFSNGISLISVPNHGKRLNRMITRRLIKENNLREH